MLQMFSDTQVSNQLATDFRHTTQQWKTSVTNLLIHSRHQHRKNQVTFDGR